MNKLFFSLIFIIFSFVFSNEAFSAQIDNEYVLKLSSEKSSSALNYFYQKNGKDKAVLSSFEIGAHHVRLGEAEREEFIKLYGSEIKYLEPNFTYSISTIPPKQWGLGEKYGVKAKKAWGITRGSKEVIVSISDTGVNYDHPALQGSMWINTGEIPNDGIDNDANGYIDDVYGYDFGNNDGDPMDFNRHGSHCAGVIAANSKKAMGLAPNVKIMAVQFLTKTGSGSLDGAIKSIEYSVNMGAQIISASWGGSGRSEALKEAIEYAETKGVLFIAAAGNDGQNNDSRGSYPANYDVANIISVGALTSSGISAWFSNYGKTSVDIYAPGVNIYSTILGEQYQALNGTSMATPYVSGAAALILSEYPNSSYQDIKDRLMKGVQKLDSLKNKCVSEGTLDAYKSLL